MAPFFVLLSALCLLHTGLTQECDDGYEFVASVPSSRYKLSPIELNWANAFTLCQSDGGGSHLIIINSDQEAEVAIELVGRLNGTGYTYAWAGINDIVQEGRWVTVQGGLVSASGYNKWEPGSPRVDTNLNCGHVHSGGLYHDGGCPEVLPFICEKPNV